MKKIGIGIIGTGGAGSGLCSIVKSSPNMELVAIAETNDERRKEICEKLQIPGYRDYQELLRHEDIYLVYNATPNFLHARVATDALKAGKHVFSEKPMGLTREEIGGMLNAEKESKKYLQIDFETRYSIMGRWITELVDAGELGEVKNIFFIHCSGGPGFLKKHGDWRANPSKVGGYYFEEGCHRLDIFRKWMGVEIEEVESIPAPGLRGPDGWHRGYREPACTLCFFPDGKLATLVTLQHRGAHPVLEPGMEPKLGHEYAASLMGSEGSIRSDFWERYIQLFKFEGPAGHPVLKRTESYKGIPHGKLFHDADGFLQDFARRILAGERPFMSAFDSWKTMAVVFACEESFKRKGERVKVNYEL
ncbi:MAG: Gfo/Idh/MocA family oxidoreductase [Candidatus Omnitrophota bacterium]